MDWDRILSGAFVGLGINVAAIVGLQWVLEARYGLDYTETVWVYFELHGVEVAEMAADRGENLAVIQTSSFIAAEGIELLANRGYVLAAGIASVAGLLAAKYRRPRSWQPAALDGAAITSGYAISAVVMLEFARQTEAALGFRAAVGPEPVAGMLYVGFVYPLIFGALGAITYVSWRIVKRRAKVRIKKIR